MTDHWHDIDDYLVEMLVQNDVVLEATLEASRAAGLPPAQVAPNQGKLLSLLARGNGARTVLEVGTLGGYSSIWLARALPEGGKLVTLELNPLHAEVAAANIARAGLADRVEIRLGPASETLAALDAEGAGPFNFVFIDADKPGYPDYFAWALRLVAPGSLIVIDNVVRAGKVIVADSSDPSTRAVRRLFELIAAEPRVSATAIQTVGSKGHDGFAVVLVLDPTSGEEANGRS